MMLMSAHAADLRIAAASDLQTVLPKITEKFEKVTGNKVTITYGASGTLFAQIKNGAPFDVFLSADIDYPQTLIRANLADPNLVVRYANGKLVLWVKNELTQQAKRDGIAILQSNLVHKIAMANPQHAPYGRAARTILEHSGMLASVQDKIVLGENISQAAQFATSGNVDAAFLSQSSTLLPQLMEKGTVVELKWEGVHADSSENSFPSVEQAGAVLKSSPNQKVSMDFMLFLLGSGSRAILRANGFVVPEPHPPCTLTTFVDNCSNLEPHIFRHPKTK
jgi:molybdate transport system substrate-binding protein